MVNLQLRLHSIFVQQEGAYASLCPELGVASQGDTQKEAFDNLRSALDALFEFAEPEDVVRRLTEDITEMLEEWNISTLKKQIEQSRRQVFLGIFGAVIELWRSQNPQELLDAEVRTPAYQFTEPVYA